MITAHYATKENELLVLAMAKRQYETTGKINPTAIQHALFGKAGGTYHIFTCKVIDDARLPRRKNAKQSITKTIRQAKSSETNSVSLQEFTLWPQSIDIDPQGVRVI
jgi:hypothetical protein